MIENIKTSKKDRPDTRFDNQESHTVAWSFFLKYLRARLQGGTVAAAAAFLEEQYRILKNFIKDSDGEKLLDAFSRASSQLHSSMDMSSMRRILSDTIILYVQCHQKSSHAAYKGGQSKGRGEPDAMKFLDSQEDALMSLPDLTVLHDMAREQSSSSTAKEDQEKDNELAEKILEKALALIDVEMKGNYRDYAFAVTEWLDSLSWVYPHVMQSYGGYIRKKIKAQPLSMSFDSHFERSGSEDVSAQTKGPFPHPTVRDLLKEFKNAFKPDSSSSSDSLSTMRSNVVSMKDASDSDVLKSGFLAVVEVEHGMGGTKSFADRLIYSIKASVEDRPRTKFESNDQSHSVAWTLSRHTLLTFSGGPAGNLVKFLRQGFYKIDRENNLEKLDDSALNATHRKNVVKEIRRLVPMGQKALEEAERTNDCSNILSTAATIFMKCSQAVGSASFTPPDGISSGHGEAHGMEVLRDSQKILKDGATDLDQQTVVKAALSLFDFDAVTLPEDSLKYAYEDFFLKLIVSFPDVMGKYGQVIKVAADKELVSHEKEQIKRKNDEKQYYRKLRSGKERLD